MPSGQDIDTLPVAGRLGLRENPLHAEVNGPPAEGHANKQAKGHADRMPEVDEGGQKSERQSYGMKKNLRLTEMMGLEPDQQTGSAGNRLLKHLAHAMSHYTVYEDKKVLMRQGSAITDDSCLFIILVGEVEIVVDGELLGVRRSGDCLGEQALYNNLPRCATVIARGTVQCASISRQMFQSLHVKSGLTDNAAQWPNGDNTSAHHAGDQHANTTDVKATLSSKQEELEQVQQRFKDLFEETEGLISASKSKKKQISCIRGMMEGFFEDLMGATDEDSFGKGTAPPLAHHPQESDTGKEHHGALPAGNTPVFTMGIPKQTGRQRPTNNVLWQVRRRVW
jgi:hypothetical protein